MSIFEVKNNQVKPISKAEQTNFLIQDQEKVQKLLRDNIELLSPKLFVIAENFSNSKLGNNQIDLLCIDQNANLVVIEFLNSDPEPSANLSFLHKSALVSKLSFNKLVKAHQAFLKQNGISDVDAQDKILKFLNRSRSTIEENFTRIVRTILISKEISEEIETTAKWLKENGVDIGWVHVNWVQNIDRILLEISDVIPIIEPVTMPINIDKTSVTKSTSTSSKQKSNFTDKVTDVAGPTPRKKKIAVKQKSTTQTISNISSQKADLDPNKISSVKSITSSLTQKSPKRKSAAKKVVVSTSKQEPNTKIQKSSKATTAKFAQSNKIARKSSGGYFDLTLSGKTWVKLTKRRLVFMVVRFVFASGTSPEKFIQECKPLPKAFIIKVQGTVNSEKFIKLATEIQKKEGESFDKNRYFCKDTEILHINGNSYAVWNQWQGSNFLQTMNNIIEKYPEYGIEFKPSK